MDEEISVFIFVMIIIISACVFIFIDKSVEAEKKVNNEYVQEQEAQRHEAYEKLTEKREKAKLLEDNITPGYDLSQSSHDCLIYRYKDGKTYKIGLWDYQFRQAGFGKGGNTEKYPTWFFEKGSS